jgi:3-hydroxybutyryl-CoA dehydrogenase
VVGAGTMGRGIAQLAAQSGIPVLLYDSKPVAAAEGAAAVAATLRGLASRGRMSVEGAEAAIALIHPVSSLVELQGCGLAVEAIVEDLGAKQKLFRELEEVLSEEAVLATNTSSLSVAALASACRRPHRVAGLHFFNPVPLMKLVEIVAAPATDPQVIDFLTQLTRGMGHQPVAARDMPGFIVNHAGRAFGPEGLRIASEGIASFATIDSVMRDVAGFRMGPFQLFDLIGLDVSRRVIESIYDQFHQEPRFRPLPMVAQRVAAGLLGRKSGGGFHPYPEEPASPPPPTPAPPAGPVWISNVGEDLSDRLRSALDAAGVAVETGAAPTDGALILLALVGTDLATACMSLGFDPTRTAAVDMLFADSRRHTLMTTPALADLPLETAVAALAATGRPVSVINDSPGFVAQRVVAQIVSVACEIAQQRIASPADIDLAVQLGLGYPQGPLAMGDAIGPRRILAVLEALHGFYGEERYRPSPWLRRRALLGLPLATPDRISV